MNQVSWPRCIAVSAVLIFAGAFSALASDRFSLSVGSRDLLLVSGANGEHKAELPLPTLSQDVVIDGTAFQVSYGKDANGLLTAIVTPNPSQPQDLHFNVLGKAIDTDKSATVTLTFSKNLGSVKVDPGYVGEVEVNSQRLNPDTAALRSLRPMNVSRTESSNDQATLAASAETNPVTVAPVAETQSVSPSTHSTQSVPPAAHEPASAVAAATATVPAPPPVTTPIPTPTAGAANQLANVTTPDGAVDGAVSDHAPLPMQVNDASQMPFTATATPGPSTVSAAGSTTAPRQHSLYWAEPITPPGGTAPKCGPDEMRLIEVKGPVSITPPGDQSRDGTEGMVIPSGTVIATEGGSSAALFMGGVNSVRLLPDTEIQVTQQTTDSTRKTVVMLHQGTVFSRVGHREGETQSYQVQTPQGVAMAKGTEFADSLTNGHHYVFVVKGIVAMLINGAQTGLLTPTSNNLAAGAMPPADDGNKVLFSVLTALQPFQTKLDKVIADINNGSATPQELGFFDSLRNTFAVLVDDVYDPTHPYSFLGAFTSNTGFGDSTHSSLERPQDYANPNPLNPFNGFQTGDAHPFFTPSVTPTFQNELGPTGNNPQRPPS